MLADYNGPKVPASTDWLERKGLIDREERQLQASGDPQFVKNIAEVMFDGIFADCKIFRDLFVRVPGNHRGDDLQFAWR